MLSESIRGVTVPKNREICPLPVVRPPARSFYAPNVTYSAWIIPVEVISNIFHLATHSSHDPTLQSISVSHVCRWWRQISLATPSLWTSIHLSFPLSKSQLTLTTAWMLRSRNHPLDVYMDFRDPSWDWDETSHVFGPKEMDNIMHLLEPQAPRWRSIELLADTWAPIFTFLSRTATIDSAPLLQTIRLARCNEYFVVPGEAFHPVNLASPVAWFRGGASLSHLRHVSLSGVHVDWTRTGFTDLRELELRYHAQDVMPTLLEFRYILFANARLEHLVIFGWGPRMDPTLENGRGSDDNPRTIDLPQLKELEIGFVDVAYGINLLSLFNLPSLRVLAVEDAAFRIHLSERQDYSPLLNHLVHMSLTGSERIPLSSLRELSLRSIYANDTSIRCFFGHLCSVTSLGLDQVDGTTVLAICSELRACDRLEGLTLKEVNPMVTALVLSSRSFPPRMRIFLDIDDVDAEDLESVRVVSMSGF